MKTTNNNVVVQIVPATNKPSGAKAKPVNSDEEPQNVWGSTEFPKAASKMVRLKSLQGTQWEAVKSMNGWTLVKFIK